MSLASRAAQALIALSAATLATTAAFALSCPECVRWHADIGPYAMGSQSLAVAETSPAATASLQPSLPHALRNTGLTNGLSEPFTAGTARTSNRYRNGESVYFSAEPVNFGWTKTDEAWSFDVIMTMEIKDARGRVLSTSEQEMNGIAEDPEKDVVQLSGYVSDLELTPGPYTIAVTYREKNGDLTAGANFHIEVVADGAAD